VVLVWSAATQPQKAQKREKIQTPFFCLLCFLWLSRRTPKGRLDCVPAACKSTVRNAVQSTLGDGMITNQQSGTNITEITRGIYRINTPVLIPGAGGGFSFNQYLITDNDPLLFHTGPRKMFPLVREAMAAVIPVERLKYVAFSHVEADECGSLNEWLAVAPQAVPVCSKVAAMVSIGDLADRPPKPINDGEVLSLGEHQLRWFDTPHMPHGWESGYFMDDSTRTLLCGDLLSQPGTGSEALTESDILGPCEAFRRQMDYYSHSKNGPAILERLAETNPTTLACMHGSAWQGDGGELIRALARSLAQ
jgi:flavorubredoxin